MRFSPLPSNYATNFEEEKDYGLVFNYKLDRASQEMSIEKAVELLGDPELRNKGREKRERLLNGKTDVTAFMVWFVENYPHSFTVTKENPGVQYSCISVPRDDL